jgi:hypothetical protein
MSASFALSFFSRRRGVAPAPTLASCVAAGLGGAAGVRSRLAAGAGADGAFALSAPFGADGRPGCACCGCCGCCGAAGAGAGAGGDASCVAEADGEERSRSFVVCRRSSGSVDLGFAGGSRCDVERSSCVVGAGGGAGAGR